MTTREEDVESLRLLPNPRYRGKLYFITLLAWGIPSLLGWVLYFVVTRTNDVPADAPGSIAFFICYIAATALTWGLIRGLVPPYFESISYELTEDEVVVRKGIITKVVKTVPYRTITNTVVSRGLLDRTIFGLGNVLIQTAGMSGATGYEENLVGLTEWEETHDNIMARLRRYRAHALSPTQAELEAPAVGEGKPGPVTGAGEPAHQILAELRRIREVLERTG